MNNIADYMADDECYSIKHERLEELVKHTLEDREIKDLMRPLINFLIAEDFLKENYDGEYTFGYQKIYENRLAAKYFNAPIEKIKQDLNKRKLTDGVLEYLTIDYFDQNGKELINEFDDDHKDRFIVPFLSSLYWRRDSQINETTVEVIENLLNTNDEPIIRNVIEALLDTCIKEIDLINAHFVHRKLSGMRPLKRDLFLCKHLLGMYEQMPKLKYYCTIAQNLNDKRYNSDQIFRWILILSWFTASNDIRLRDNASKGLANLLRNYPDLSVDLLEASCISMGEFICKKNELCVCIQ